MSTHVLDTERGEPAQGVPVTLSRQDGDELVVVFSQRTNEDGRIPDLAPQGVRPGTYQLAFDAAAYFRAQGYGEAFLSNVVIEFRIADTTRHYHIPLLLSRYSCASYRGS